VEAAAKRFEALGAHVEDVGPVIEPLQNFFEPLWIGSFATRFRQIPTQLHAKLDPGFRAAAEKGLSITLADYAKSYEAKSKLARDMALWHQKYDLLLSPVTPTAAPPVEHALQLRRLPALDQGAHPIPCRST
jgi:aspartyl-tRNA(Asn)/glutamyl-tRNA(Gln) amidotransferase subunit A